MGEEQQRWEGQDSLSPTALQMQTHTSSLPALPVPPSPKPASGKRKAPEGVTYPWEKQNTPFPPTLAYFFYLLLLKSLQANTIPKYTFWVMNRNILTEKGNIYLQHRVLSLHVKEKAVGSQDWGQTVSRAEWRTLNSKHNYAKISALEGRELKAIICSNRNVFVHTHTASDTYVSFV